MELDSLSPELVSSAFYILQGRVLQGVKSPSGPGHISPFLLMLCAKLLHENGYQCIHVEMIHKDPRGELSEVGPDADEIWTFVKSTHKGKTETIKLLVDFNENKDKSFLRIHYTGSEESVIILNNYNELCDFIRSGDIYV